MFGNKLRTLARLRKGSGDWARGAIDDYNSRAKITDTPIKIKEPKPPAIKTPKMPKGGGWGGGYKIG